MAVHDAYARLTPYEMVFPDPAFPLQRFRAVEAEAQERGADLGNPAAFAMLGAAQGTLAELRPDDAGPEFAGDHGGVLYFAYHMWRRGCSVTLVSARTLRRLLKEEIGEPGWEGTLLERGGYVQFPRHMVWIEEQGADGPESGDGFFWAAHESGILEIAVVAGIREGRPGYRFVPVPPQPLASLPEWAVEPAREGGREFETALPGAELDGLLGVRTPAEVYKLVALCLRATVARRASEAPEATPQAGCPANPSPSCEERGGTRPTALPYVIL